MLLNLLAIAKYVSRLFRFRFGLGLWLLCTGFCAWADQDNGNSADFDTNSPNIYVDYDRAKTPSMAEITATNGLGYWIWDRRVLDKQTIHLWKSFTIPASKPVTKAELRISADNAFRVWIDGQEIGSGSDWRTLSIYELSGHLAPGIHVLAVEGFNDCDKAGVIVGLRMKLADGTIMHVRSDISWRVVPNHVSGWLTARYASPAWPRAAFIATLGQAPWWAVPKTVAHIHESLPEPLRFWQTRDFQYSLITGCAIFVVTGIYLLIQLVSQKKTHTSLQIERDRIARDLHDDLGSKITELLLTGEGAQIRQRTRPDDASHLEPVEEMCKGARNILATIDEIVWIVNSQHNTLDDFANQVCKHTERFLESTPIRFRFDVDYELPPRTLTQFARRNLFLAVKEALNNVVKHSHATELTIRIRLDGDLFLISVEENGIGFDPQMTNPERNGLHNMILRMEEIGGQVQVVSQPGEGCKVCLSLPLKRPGFLRFFSRTPSHPVSSRPLPKTAEAAGPEPSYTDKV